MNWFLVKWCEGNSTGYHCNKPWMVKICITTNSCYLSLNQFAFPIAWYYYKCNSAAWDLNLFSGYRFDERVQTENLEKKNLSIIDKFITHDVYIATINNNREKKPLLT